MNEEPVFDAHVLHDMNEKAIQNQLFTPDHVYIDLPLFKDIPLGVVYTDLFRTGTIETQFKNTQTYILQIAEDYQKRRYDTVEPYLTPLGWSDDKVAAFLQDYPKLHDAIFAASPSSRFLNLITRHTIRNQNNSRPAGKYNKVMIDKDQYVMEAIPVTYYLNTYPLVLSAERSDALAKELGEALGVNMVFMCKHPSSFTEADWGEWMSKIDCFYLDSLGKFTRGDMVFAKQGQMLFTGKYVFARKRFEKAVMNDMKGQDFEQQIQMLTAQTDVLCEFSWLTHNDLRLTSQAVTMLTTDQ